MKGAGMAWNESRRQRQRALQRGREVTFVHREEFCRLLLSFKKLIRSDEPAVRIRGLTDVESGERYLIDQEELFGCALADRKQSRAMDNRLS
jgi:hypothetical protein